MLYLVRAAFEDRLEPTFGLLTGGLADGPTAELAVIGTFGDSVEGGPAGAAHAADPVPLGVVPLAQIGQQFFAELQ